MSARIVTSLPDGDDWSYEVKLDGYRALVIKDGERIQLRSRTGKDLTRTYQPVATAAAKLRTALAVLDGEIVAIDASGRPSFQALQHRSAHRDYTIVFYAFDLLHEDGTDLKDLPLATRRERLTRVLGNSGILLSIELPGTPQEVIEAVSGLGLEGIVAKRRSSRYTPGERHSAWVKLKLDRQQEFVIGGYRPGPYGVDALLVGYHDDGGLRFAAKIRAGFTPHLRREVFGQLKGHHVRRCPFIDLPHTKASRWGGGVTAEQMADMQWVEPTLVAQVRFVEWTAEGHLRHAAFLGLRTDKPARAVRREP